MDFDLSGEQLALLERYKEFGAGLFTEEEALEADAEQRFDREKWKRCAEEGLLGLNIDPKYGGQGLDHLSSVVALVGFGEGCVDNGIPFGVSSQLLSAEEIIVQFGDETQKQTYLPAMCSGDTIGAFAITEPETGSDSYALKTSAVLDGDEYVLNGHKSYITLAPESDIAIIFANTTPGSKWGVTAFIVPTDTPGCEATDYRPKTGVRSIHMGDFILEDCRIPVANRLGAEGSGTAAFLASMNTERAFIFATQLGAMKRQLAESIAYAKEREAFGHPIGDFQSVSNRLADMKLRISIGELLLYRTAWMMDQGRPVEFEAALTNLHISESFIESSLDSIRTFGAKGYVAEFGVERNLRDALGGVIYSGTSDILRNVITRFLGL